MVFPDHQKESVHLSQEGQRPIFRLPAPSPRPSSPFSWPLPGLCFDLSSEVPLVPLLLPPHVSQVPTGTWKVGCAQRLERKLQQDNYGGQCPVDVISAFLLRPEVGFFSLIFLQVTLLPHPAQCLSASLCKSSGIVWMICVSLFSNSTSTGTSHDLGTCPLIRCFLLTLRHLP